ncbi:MAG TPA: hypothetical protein VJC37_08360, partial [Planctomycetota bacterium]|nr:hypothetical protein [Planctomycetota bacterium]
MSAHQFKRRLIAICVILAVGLAWTPSIKSQEDVTIQNINFGELLLGDNFSADDLQDCVVGVDFDGMTCQTCPCGGAINTFLEWHQKYNSQGFTLLSFYVKDDAKEKFAAFCKSRKVPFPVYYGGRISGLEITDLPAFVLFDHTGKMIFSGHPKDADAKIAEAMKAAPDYLTGAGPYKKL